MELDHADRITPLRRNSINQTVSLVQAFRLQPVTATGNRWRKVEINSSHADFTASLDWSDTYSDLMPSESQADMFEVIYFMCFTLLRLISTLKLLLF